ncbi:aspartic peptidase domain-containing protein [Blyttiomyces helicus]|uniref:Aspartic peptidase domain-containing protein n=1 Tax=Blyttiomyces helicus TaxID=388810 RepID=A0A4P9WEA2_9FUNG|nr:aspartic peptidase domain-containing protein [Blyttiomyces helicus]|eukprot:RKO90914.1 aspartic peptidase domain-containing protein [Blyttiomyces helicus]
MKNALLLSALAATATASPLVQHSTSSTAPHRVSVPIFPQAQHRLPPRQGRGQLGCSSRSLLHPAHPRAKRRGMCPSPTRVIYSTFVPHDRQHRHGQVFTVDLDTGSRDLWVPGPNCASKDGSCTAGGGPINLADTSVQSAGLTFSVSYGTGSVTGDVYSAPYTLAGATTSKGYFGVTTCEFNQPSQGLLGLFFSAGNDGDVTAKVGWVPIVALGLQSFGFYLSNSDNGDSGTFTTNGFDASHVSGPFTFEAVQPSSGNWQFDVSHGSVTIGNNTADLSVGGSVNNAVADTGTTNLIVPTSVATAIWGAIGATNNGSSIPSSVAQTGPDVDLTFSQTAYSVAASVYVFDIGNGTCASGISGGAETFGVSLFGDIFLRNWYSLFDVANSRISFAKALHP